jgi:hypothetical protein
VDANGRSLLRWVGRDFRVLQPITQRGCPIANFSSREILARRHFPFALESSPAALRNHNGA